MSATHNTISSLLAKNVNNKHALSVIDYGCGAGDLLNYLEKKVLLKKYSGFDISENTIKTAIKKFPGKKYTFVHIAKDQKLQLAPSSSQDAVILVGVLQYMTNAQIGTLCSEAYRILKADGILVLSTTTDAAFYRLVNLYQLVTPHRYFKESFLKKILNKHNFSATVLQKGLVVAPLFSSVFSLLFDGLDKLIFKTKGDLGPIGKFVRKHINKIIEIEYLLPLNIGYTTFVVAKKKS